jgi:hypothetical protein
LDDDPLGLVDLEAAVWLCIDDRSACESRNWYSRTYLAINQGPIVAMIENYRTGFLWNLFMGATEVRTVLSKLGFNSPHLDARNI